MLFCTIADTNCITDKRQIKLNAAVVDFLVKVVFLPYEIRNRETAYFPLDSYFRLHVTLVVCFENRPLIRSIGRNMKQRFIAVIGIGDTKILDESFALCHLLLFEFQDRADSCQRQRQSKVSGRCHRAVPRIRTKIIADRILWNAVTVENIGIIAFQPDRQAYALKRSVEAVLCDRIVRQGMKNIIGERLTAGKVNDLHRSIVYGIGKQQNIKIRRIGIAVYACFGNVCVAAGFQVNHQFMHIINSKFPTHGSHRKRPPVCISQL